MRNETIPKVNQHIIVIVNGTVTQLLNINEARYEINRII